MADRRLQIFHAVARAASFTRAADVLMMSQPAVTVQVRLLEEQYRTRLFDRQRQGVTLTPAGERLFDYAQRILALSDEMDACMAEFSGGFKGELNIGASQTPGEYLLPDLMLAFTDRYPHARLRLTMGSAAELESRLAEQQLDCAVLEYQPQSAGLEAEALGSDELVVICAPDHPLAGQRRLTARSLSGYEYIAREPGSATRAQTDRYLREHKVEPDSLKILMELGAPAPLKRFVERGLGFSVMSRLAVDHEVVNGTLVAIPFRPALRRDLYLVRPTDRYRASLLVAFLDFARGHLKELLS